MNDNTLNPLSPSQPAPAAGGLSHFAKVANVATMVMTFAVVGPPAGWLTLFAPLSIYSLLSGPIGSVSAGQLFGNITLILVTGILFSYLLGLPAALLAGLGVGLGQLVFRSFGILHAAVVGLAVGFVLVWRPDLFSWGLNSIRDASLPLLMDLPSQGIAGGLSSASFVGVTLMSGILGFFCMFPTVACWAIGRRLQIGATRASPC